LGGPVLSQHAIFENVNEVDRLRLSRSLKVVELKSGQCLIDENEEHDGAYLLQVGCLFFLRGSDSPLNDALDDGSGSLLTSVTPGDMIQWEVCCMAIKRLTVWWQQHLFACCVYPEKILTFFPCVGRGLRRLC